MTISSQPIPFTSQWAIVQGLPMHTRVPVCMPQNGLLPIVLVHGMLLASRYLLPTATLLARDYPVYVPDLPGFGRSFGPPHALDIAGLADALADWMTASHLNQTIMLGNSLGCQVIVAFALRYPHRLRAAILQGPTVDAHARTFPQQLLRLICDAPNESLSLYPLILSDTLAAGLRRMLSTLRIVLADRIETRLPHVQAPTLVVRGTRDPLVSQRWATAVTRLLPRGELQLIPNVGHTPNYSAPHELVQVIQPFLQQHAAPRASNPIQRTQRARRLEPHPEQAIRYNAHNVPEDWN